jgi:hypothetical protein
MSWTKSDSQSILGSLFPFVCLQESPGIDLFAEIPSLERFTKDLEKGLECASLNKHVRGGMTLLKFRSSRVGISNESTGEILSEDPWSFTTVRLTKVTRALHTLPLFLSTFVNSNEIGIVDPPKVHENIWTVDLSTSTKKWKNARGGTDLSRQILSRYPSAVGSDRS